MLNFYITKVTVLTAEITSLNSQIEGLIDQTPKSKYEESKYNPTLKPVPKQPDIATEKVIQTHDEHNNIPADVMKIATDNGFEVSDLIPARGILKKLEEKGILVAYFEKLRERPPKQQGTIRIEIGTPYSYGKMATLTKMVSAAKEEIPLEYGKSVIFLTESGFPETREIFAELIQKVMDGSISGDEVYECTEKIAMGDNSVSRVKKMKEYLDRLYSQLHDSYFLPYVSPEKRKINPSH